MPRMVGSPVPLQACCNHSGFCAYICRDGWGLSWGLAKRKANAKCVCVCVSECTLSLLILGMVATLNLCVFVFHPWCSAAELCTLMYTVSGLW